MSRPPKVSTDEILIVARAHFLKHGHSASLKGIATELGLSHSALVQRFGSKREILLQAMRPPSELPWPQVFLKNTPMTDQEAYQTLCQVGEMLNLFFREHLPRIRILQTAGADVNEVFCNGIPLPMVAVRQINQWVSKGIKQSYFFCEDVPSWSAAFVGSMFSYVHLSQCHELLINQTQMPTQFKHALPNQSEIGDLQGVIDLFFRMIRKDESNQ